MKIDVDGIARQLQEKINSILRNNSRVELYQQIGEVLRSQMIEEQFTTLGKYFTNEQWQPLSAGYKKAKEAKGRKGIADLQDTGNLARSFSYKVLPNGVQLYNSAEYAPAHQYGYEGSQNIPTHTRKGKGGKSYKVSAFTRKVNIPARPIFPVELELPTETMEEIEDVVRIWLIDQLNR